MIFSKTPITKIEENMNYMKLRIFVYLSIAPTISFVGCSSQKTEFASAQSYIKAVRISGGNVGDFQAPRTMANTIDDDNAEIPAISSDSEKSTEVSKTQTQVPSSPSETQNQSAQNTSQNADAKSSSQQSQEGAAKQSPESNQAVTQTTTPSSEMPPPQNTSNSEQQKTSQSNKLSELDQKKLSACLEKLNINLSGANTRLVEVGSRGQNLNNQTLFEDVASSPAQIFLVKVFAQNINNSSIKLLNSESTYCIDMQVKNMNNFRFNMA